jgi:hypothetical protein
MARKINNISLPDINGSYINDSSYISDRSRKLLINELTQIKDALELDPNKGIENIVRGKMHTSTKNYLSGWTVDASYKDILTCIWKVFKNSPRWVYEYFYERLIPSKSNHDQLFSMNKHIVEPYVAEPGGSDEPGAAGGKQKRTAHKKKSIRNKKQHTRRHTKRHH